MATTSDIESSWDAYGKWTLVALVLLLAVGCIIAVVYSWQQGYFDTIAPSIAQPSSQSTATASLNFSSYRSTLNAQIRGSTPPAYTPNRLAHGRTPEPTYRSQVRLSEQAAHEVCPLPIQSSPRSIASHNPYAGAIDAPHLSPPAPAATNAWETVKTGSLRADPDSLHLQSLQPIVNGSRSGTQSGTRSKKASSTRGSVPQSPRTGASARSNGARTGASSRSSRSKKSADSIV